MYIINPEIYDESKLFICKDKYLCRYLIKNKIPYISRNKADKSFIFVKTKELEESLIEYQKMKGVSL